MARKIPKAAGVGSPPATPAAPLPLSRQICFSLYTATNRVIRRYRPHLEPLGLTYPQYLVMLVLWQDSPASVGELGRQLDLEFGSITPLLKRMEKLGLVRRQRDSADERRVLIHLTDHGDNLRHKAGEVRPKLLCEVPICHDDLIDLHHRLGRLIEALDSKPT